ncbi:hypothetical protein AALP_AA4G026200 [Arabis alpina]|uniref:Hydroxyproline-rich glycoprotein family protein n=1 Tax=Arabis alpina TaxID=50452 RepID=A0A087H0Q4_ARAAL|nr:hypothetical protein AALP_AA4G026200 [Arabis alpina]
MRSVIGKRLPNPKGFTFTSLLKQTQNPFLIQPISHFSSDGSGRGRGRGFSDGRDQFGINHNESVNQGSESQSHGGYGHGRGRPIPPPFTSFVGSDSPSLGRGRGSIGSGSDPFSQSSPIVESQGSEEKTQMQVPVKTPVFTELQEIKEETLSTETPPENIFNALGSESSNLEHGNGAGSGKPLVESAPARNEHIRRPQPPQPQQKRAQKPQNEAPRPKLSAEEAGRRARSELSRGEAVEGSGVRGGRGRGRGRGVKGGGRGGRGGEVYGNDKKEGEAEQEALSVFVGDSADGEKFAKKMGTELMKELADGFEEICNKALPSTANDALVDAHDLNCMIEFEPEYIMPDFGSNPDIDEKPPMPLRECIEKVKPFIVAYEGIKDQEEWEEAVKEVMEQAPLLKEIVDHYSGPDRVTAKKQNEELDRIATTIPKSAPDSVKRFADRVALSLKSNPGWGFDKKYKFMDKVVMEVSQSYK